MINKNIHDYVCPKCFKQIHNCTCKFQPYSLIWIDRKLQYTIRILNQKGYITNSCCQGHFKECEKRIFIAFVEKIDSCPKGWKKDSNYIYFDIHAKTEEEFNTIQKNEIKKLEEWANNILPIRIN